MKSVLIHDFMGTCEKAAENGASGGYFSTAPKGCRSVITPHGLLEKLLALYMISPKRFYLSRAATSFAADHFHHPGRKYSILLHYAAALRLEQSTILRQISCAQVSPGIPLKMPMLEFPRLTTDADAERC
jgi:hypothetical protein